jgi:hypothetical protein
MSRPSPSSELLVILLCLGLASCGLLPHRRPAPPPPPPPPPGQPLTPEPSSEKAEEDEALVVKKVEEPIVVAAWAEPRELPPGGGEAQILVRVQKRGGRRFPGVEVRLHTSTGTLYSAGRTLVTDERGMTRDRLSTRRTATITMNAGGTRYRFQVPVGETPP